MKKTTQKIFAVMLLLTILSSCKQGLGSSSHSKTASGLEYEFYKQTPNNKKVKEGDFLTLHLIQTDKNDTVIYSSYKKQNPMEFRYTKTLFRGALNEGFTMMSPGDSASFWVLVDSIYGNHIPQNLKNGEKCKYTISMLKIQTPEEYQQSQSQELQKKQASEKIIIDEYLSKNNLSNFTILPSGVRYKIEKEGTGIAPDMFATLKAIYTTTELSQKQVLETSNNQPAELPLTKMTNGFREGVQFFKKGSKGTIIVPSTSGYGKIQKANIPPNAILLYDLEIKDVVPGKIDNSNATTTTPNIKITPTSPKK